MPVESIECQLVRAQIGRYLAGDPISADSIHQLEIHLLACDGCKAALASRKAELKAKVAPGHAVARVPEPAAEQKPNVPKEKRAAVNIKAIQAFASSARQAEPNTAPAKLTFAKPLFLTLALAGVLIAMSRMSNRGSFSFGSLTNSVAAIAAQKPAAAQADPAPTPEPSTQPQKRPSETAAPMHSALQPPAPTTVPAHSAIEPQHPATPASKPAVHKIVAAPTVSRPVKPTHVSRPHRVVRALTVEVHAKALHRSRRHAARRWAWHRKPTARPQSHIVVYDNSGSRINP